MIQGAIDLPEGLIEVGQSELAAFRQCPLMHKFRWREGWHFPIRAVGEGGNNSKSEIGTQWHIIQAAHYRQKMKTEAAGEEYSLDAARGAMAAALLEIVEIYEATEERLYLLRWMAEGYLKRWGVDPDWEVLAVEERLRVPVADPDNSDAPPEFALRFTGDLVVRHRRLKRVIIIDNKTVEGRGHWGAVDVDLHDQLGIYVRGWARMFPNDPPLFALLNQVRRDKLKTRTMTLDERFSRPRSTRTPLELDEIERDALSDMRRMHGAENLRRPTSHPDPKTCAWKCDFREAHIALRRSGGDWSRAVEIINARGMSQDPTTDPALGVR